jgi:hypothetical protein
VTQGPTHEPHPTNRQSIQRHNQVNQKDRKSGAPEALTERSSIPHGQDKMSRRTAEPP